MTQALNNLRVWMVRKHLPAHIINMISKIYLRRING